jgi:beta-lactam-binding protein with PASTA domain
MCLTHHHKEKFMNLKNYLWLTPFCSFMLGYCAIQKIMHIPEHTTANLIGKQLHEILPLVTQYNLNIRLLDQKEEADLPEGIILNQTPAAGTIIKPHQPLFIVTSKKPLATRAPQCIGIKSDTLVEQLKKEAINYRVYHLPHPYPEHVCFAQSPQYNEPLEKKRMIVYISSGNNKPIIWPNFSGIPLYDVIDFLDNYAIQPHVINDDHFYNKATAVVIDQRPVAGTLLTIDEHKPLSVQLRVS